MLSRNNIYLQQKQLSPDAFWEKIEEIYGGVPELIKKILQVNGFDSYLALKGIRFDDKSEFFDSLQATVREIIASNENDSDKEEICGLLSGSDLKNFKLKPGHKNFIMNLMREIDNSDANEFFKTPQVNPDTSQMTLIKIPAVSPTPVEIKYEMVSNVTNEQQQMEEYEYHQNEQIYMEDHDHESNEKGDDEEEYLLEEFLSDEHQSLEGVEMEGYMIDMPTTKRRRGGSAMRVHRKPERMYNEEFISSKSNPRRRRVTTSKLYPNTDKGTEERFRDLMQQSMHCILSREQLSVVENNRIDIEKQSDSCWSVKCPLCQANIKLAVVYENNGKYVNYKRSNFERHLRYKHCKTFRKPAKQSNQFFLPSSPSSITNSFPKFSVCSLKIPNN
jgi:hypothetical protein